MQLGILLWLLNA